MNQLVCNQQSRSSLVENKQDIDAHRAWVTIHATCSNSCNQYQFMLSATSYGQTLGSQTKKSSDLFIFVFLFICLFVFLFICLFVFFVGQEAGWENR